MAVHLSVLVCHWSYYRNIQIIYLSSQIAFCGSLASAHCLPFPLFPLSPPGTASAAPCWAISMEIRTREIWYKINKWKKNSTDTSLNIASFVVTTYRGETSSFQRCLLLSFRLLHWSYVEIRGPGCKIDTQSTPRHPQQYPRFLEIVFQDYFLRFFLYFILFCKTLSEAKWSEEPTSLQDLCP